MSETRFILFGFDTYYPNGGAGDIKGLFATEDEARAAIPMAPTTYKTRHQGGIYQYGNFEIYDIEKQDVIAEFEKYVSPDDEDGTTIVRERTA